MAETTTMTAAQDLLVELGCCFSSALNGLPGSAADGHFSMASSAILAALGRSTDQHDADIRRILEAGRNVARTAEVIDRSASQMGAAIAAEDLPDILAEFCVAYCYAERFGEDIPEKANLQTATRTLLEALSGETALPEHVEDVFPFETCLSDA